MRALITGASGFVGNHLVPHLVAAGDEVLGTGLPVNSPAEAPPPWPTVPLDIRDASACRKVIDEFRPDVIYHLAGMAFVPDAERDFNQALLVNVAGTYNIFNSRHDLRMNCKIVFISTGEVYGRIDPSDLPVTESTPLRPANNYSLSKVMAELLSERFLRQSWVPCVMMRPFNHIGPGQRPDFAVSSFAQQLARIACGKADPVLHVGNLDAKRDFTDVRDIVRGYRLAALMGTGTYNLCSGKGVAMSEILNTLIQIAGVKVNIERDPARLRPSDVPEIYGSYARAAKELNWRPEISLQQSLQDVYASWLARTTAEGSR